MSILCFQIVRGVFLYFVFLFLVDVASGVGGSGLAWAQKYVSHSHDTVSLHFSHPLISESPSPDTKVRFDYFLRSEPGEEDEPGGDRHTLRLEAEYAFAPWLSMELDAPYTFLELDDGGDSHRLDNVEIGLKYANFTFSGYGLLLGGGVELGLPTGSEDKGIGSDHVIEVEPFADFGYMRDRWEVVGFTSFGVPLNENGEDEADLELGWNLSILYHVASRLQALAELDGEHVFGGEEDGTNVVNLTPGIKIQPLHNSGFQFGMGVSLPLTDDKEFDLRTVLSLFYHFHYR